MRCKLCFRVSKVLFKHFTRNRAYYLTSKGFMVTLGGEFSYVSEIKNSYLCIFLKINSFAVLKGTAPESHANLKQNILLNN